MTIEIKSENLFAAFAEFNQITGILMVALDSHPNTKKEPIWKFFPEFCKAVDAINNEMQQYAIT